MAGGDEIFDEMDIDNLVASGDLSFSGEKEQINSDEFDDSDASNNEEEPTPPKDY